VPPSTWKGAASALARGLKEAAEEVEAESENSTSSSEDGADVHARIQDVGRNLLADAGLFLARETDKEWVVFLSHSLGRGAHVTVDYIDEHGLHVVWKSAGPNHACLRGAAELLDPLVPLERWALIQERELQCYLPAPRALNPDKSRLKKKLVPTEADPFYLVVVVPFHVEEDQVLEGMEF